jgi:N-glycosylase/DNA lyase
LLAVECDKSRSKVLQVREYALGMTLTSGQAFRWERTDDSWTGIVAGRWVRLRQISMDRGGSAALVRMPLDQRPAPVPQGSETGILAETPTPVANWDWLEHYLQSGIDLAAVLDTFPRDEPMQAAAVACRGLRLLRQDPWECLASFILSSTKRILQIQQIVSLVCERFGEPIMVPEGWPAAFGFPTPERLASVAEAELRQCKMGFRAPFLLSAARRVAEGKLDLQAPYGGEVHDARGQLVACEGVGEKIANCVLLFAYGRQEAFPVDVWVMKALRQLYFPRKKCTLVQLQKFASDHFGPNAGYAQQYLFHYARSHLNHKTPS